MISTVADLLYCIKKKITNNSSFCLVELLQEALHVKYRTKSQGPSQESAHFIRKKSSDDALEVSKHL